MGRVVVAGIIINILMVFIILGVIWLAISYNNILNTCINDQSPFCYTIQCPNDLSTVGPCFGYAKMPVGNGNWKCSNAPLTIVDSNGNII